MSPARIQRSRAAGWRMPPGTVYVGRGTKWGNPIRIGQPVIDADTGRVTETTREEAVRVYEVALRAGRLPMHGGQPITVDMAHAELAGRDLACWCPLDGRPCHADVLLELANAPAGT